MENVKVKIENVYKIFGNQPKKGIKLAKSGLSKDDVLAKTNQVLALNDVSLEICDGEVFVVMGLSGSGKSTLIRCINRLINPTAGSIMIDDQDITKLGIKELNQVRRRKMGMVFQNFGLFPHMTILENSAYGLKIQGVEKSKREKIALEAIGTVGLKGWEDNYPDQLSGGMQQRVGLARALANDPDILLMDEAFSALDPLIRSDMQDELLELQEKMNKTIIFITHDLNEALKLGDRIALMKDGKVVQIGTPEDILTKPADDYVERFVQDVDKTKVLTVSKIMKKPIATVNISSSPKTGIDKMLKNQIDSMFVIDDDFKLIGLVRKASLIEELKKEDASLENCLVQDFYKMKKDDSIEDAFEHLAASNEPVAVVSHRGKLQGIIVRKDIIKAIAERTGDR